MSHASVVWSHSQNTVPMATRPHPAHWPGRVGCGFLPCYAGHRLRTVSHPSSILLPGTHFPSSLRAGLLPSSPTSPSKAGVPLGVKLRHSISSCSCHFAFFTALAQSVILCRLLPECIQDTNPMRAGTLFLPWCSWPSAALNDLSPLSQWVFYCWGGASFWGSMMKSGP